MSLPAFHRFWPPGARPAAWASAQPAHGALEARLAVGRQLVDELTAAGHAEPGRHADVVERAFGVVEPEQQRADASAVFVRAEAGDHAVGGPLVLDLDMTRLSGR